MGDYFESMRVGITLFFRLFVVVDHRIGKFGAGMEVIDIGYVLTVVAACITEVTMK